jgi:hypothetical protein
MNKIQTDMDQFSSHPLYRKHDLDSVMSSLWSFYTKNFLVLFLTTFVFNLVVRILYSTIDFTQFMSMTDPFEMIEAMKQWTLPMLGMVAISFLLMVILQYYIIYKPVDDTVNIFNSTYKSLKYLPTYFILMIFFMIFASFAILAGIIAFLIGVLFSILYIYMIFFFMLPTLMAEGNKIGNSIGRSFTLSHRHFGPNLGWTAVILLIVIVGTIVLSSLILLPFAGSFFKIITNPENALEAMSFMSNPWYIGLSALANALFTPVLMIFSAIIYFNARARENEASNPIEGTTEPDKVKVEDLYARPYSEDHPDNPDKK